MAGVQIPPRRHRQVLGSRTAAGQTLGHTRSAFQIQHKMEECKSFAISLAFHHCLCQRIVFAEDLRQVALAYGIGIRLFPHHRLDRYLLET